MSIKRLPEISRRSLLLSLLATSTLTPKRLLAHTPRATITVTRGPYLQRCKADGIVLMWRTSEPCSTQVRYGAHPRQLDAVFTVDGRRTEHVARLNGLQSNTRYYYSIGTPDQELAGGDARHFFITAPAVGAPRSTRIWVLGDSGSVTPELLSVRDSYLAYTGQRGTDLWLMLGDNAYASGSDAEYQTALFDVFGDLLCNTTLWPAFGNHDSYCSICDTAGQEGPFFDIFKTPTYAEAGGIPSGYRNYYSFDYANIHFVCLNSIDWQDSPMIDWLHADLSANVQPWIVAFWHYPPYTKGPHDSDLIPELIEVRKQIVPVLEQYGVDLVLTGHNHCYERSYLLHGHYGPSETLSHEMILDAGDGSPAGAGAYIKTAWGAGAGKGTVYVAAGCASYLKGGPLNHPAMCTSLSVTGAMVIDVKGYQLNYVFLDGNGDVRDQFSIQKDALTFLPVSAR